MPKSKTAPKPVPARKVSTEGLSAKQKAALAKALSKTPGSYWKGEVDGDYIAGKIESVEMLKGEHGQYPVLTIQTRKGREQVSCGTVLASEVERHKLTAGMEVVIVYRGKSKSGKKGNPANLYTVEVV